MPVYQNKDKNGKVIKDTKGNSWYYRCYYTDKYGKRKQKQSKMYKSSSVASTEETKFLFKNQHSVMIENGIVFDNVYYEWLDSQKKRWKPSSYYCKKHKCDKYIYPYFKGCKLSNIHVPQIINWYDEFWKNKNSVEYNNVIIGYAYEIFSYIRDNYEIDTKVLGKLQKKRSYEIKDKPKDSEVNFWTLEEFNIFLEYVNDEFYKLIYMFLFYTGLRLGEMIALTWEDINFNTKELRINKSFTNKCEDDYYIITDPKTKNSIRIIDIDDNLLELLKQHYIKESKIYQFNRKMLIFGNIKHISPTSFSRYMNKIIDNIRNDSKDFKRITPHGFRHSHVTLLIGLGCDKYEVAERIGDTPETVEKTYYHILPKKKSHTVGVLNQLKN